MKLFVYGTLKRGHTGHYLLREDLAGAPASVRGTLYELPQGYPALSVPQEDVRAVGTSSPDADARTEEAFGAEKIAPKDGPRVHGEVFRIEGPPEWLSKLDRYEGFDPRGASLYRRVLIPVHAGPEPTPAWTYVMDSPTGKHLPEGRWPADSMESGRKDREW